MLMVSAEELTKTV